MATICVVGLWHQASVLSACLADMGHQVRGVGDEEEVVAALNAGQPPVYEPKLGDIIRRNLEAGRLKYTTDYREALDGAEFAYIAIDTPVGPDDESDLNPIFDAARHVGQAMPVLSRSPDPEQSEGEGAAKGSGELILIVSAQVPVGTCERIAAVVQEQNQRRCPEPCPEPRRRACPELAEGAVEGSSVVRRPSSVAVAYVPEFLRLGTAVETFRRADRFVIGCDDPAVAKRVAALYEPLGCPIICTDIRSAEMAKHAANVFLATSISFINEIANLCEILDADALEVARILKLDRRIGKYAFLSPGLGFAGGTLGREIRALQKFGAAHQVQTPLLDAVWQVNAQRARLVSRRLRAALGSLEGCQIGVLGLTYKPGTSTLRRAISLDIIRDLIRQGAAVTAFDPLANLAEVPDLPPIRMCADPYGAAQGSTALVLITEWADIGSLDLPRLRAAMQGDVFLDTRNLLDPARMIAAGFRYFGIGRRGKP